MNVKINTKEKFHEILVLDSQLSANMTEKTTELLTNLRETDVRNVIMVMTAVKSMDVPYAENLMTIQVDFLEKNASFVICELNPEVEDFLDSIEILQLMNITSNISEAWDIVQMEEIERELMGE